MLGLFLMTIGFGWAAAGFLSVFVIGTDAPSADLTLAGESLLWSFVLLSHLVFYWAPGITVGLVGIFFRRKVPKRAL